MKRVLLIISVSAFLLTGCKGSNGSSSETDMKAEAAKFEDIIERDSGQYVLSRILEVRDISYR